VVELVTLLFYLMRRYARRMDPTDKEEIREEIHEEWSDWKRRILP
jgi:hypothetical protein